MKIVFYTALIGDIDRLYSVMPEYGVRFVAFVDGEKREVGRVTRDGLSDVQLPTVSPVWEQRVVALHRDARRTARLCKTLPHRFFPDADIWFWVDANIRLTIPVTQAVAWWLRGDLATLRHPDRCCLYDEAEFCCQRGKDTCGALREQANRYRAAGMPARWGLAETGVLIRRNTPAMRELNEAWWGEIERGSCRDQVALPFVCWRMGVRWDDIPVRGRSVRDGWPFVYIKHAGAS